MLKPTAVLISDIHYNIQTLEVADKALRMAVDTTNRLGVPLIIAGDLHDTKANIRGECIKPLIRTIKLCDRKPFLIRGNHDSLNEKSKEHALQFLESNACLINKSQVYDLKFYFIPYHNDADELRAYLKTLPKGSTLIMHQGVIGSEGGHYIQDKSALGKNDLAGFRVISGHYHIRQSFELPEGGRFDYLGNPYTLGFGEASHPEKGFQVLYDDGSLVFVPTNLRRHRIIEVDVLGNDHYSWVLEKAQPVLESDILWLKVTGASDELSKLNKEKFTKIFSLKQDFRLDLIPTDTTTSKIETSKDVTQVELLDNLIDSLTNTDDNRKVRLKSLWKQLK